MARFISKRETEFVKKKVGTMKGMLKCASTYLRDDGTFSACSGCDNSVICGLIRTMVRAKIETARNTVRRWA